MKNSINSSRKDTRPKNAQKNRNFKISGTGYEGTANPTSGTKAGKKNKSQSKNASQSKSK